MISFIVPAYNEEALLALCLKSIIEEAGGINYELIVVDNNSTDNTAEVARGCGARVISEPRKGVTRARQAGLQAAKYDLVAFIDADNQLPSGWLDIAFNAFNRPGVIAVSGPVVYNDLPVRQRVISFIFYTVAKAAHQVAPMIQGGNFVLDRASINLAGGFDTEIEFYGEDTATAVRLSKLGKIKFDLNLCVWSSARRMQKEGMVLTGSRYILNYVWVHLSGRPWTQHYDDIRPK